MIAGKKATDIRRRQHTLLIKGVGGSLPIRLLACLGLALGLLFFTPSRLIAERETANRFAKNLDEAAIILPLWKITPTDRI